MSGPTRKYDFEIRLVGPYRLHKIVQFQGKPSYNQYRKWTEGPSLRRVEVRLAGQYVWSFPSLRLAKQWCKKQLKGATSDNTSAKRDCHCRGPTEDGTGPRESTSQHPEKRDNNSHSGDE